MSYAVTMIAALCVKLGISERVRDVLPQTTATRKALTRCSWEDYKGTRFYNGQLDTPQLGGLQGYPVLQRPASSFGRAVAQPSGRRCLGSPF